MAVVIQAVGNASFSEALRAAASVAAATAAPLALVAVADAATWSPNTRLRIARLLSGLHARARQSQSRAWERAQPQERQRPPPPMGSRLRSMLNRAAPRASRVVAVGPE